MYWLHAVRPVTMGQSEHRGISAGSVSGSDVAMVLSEPVSVWSPAGE